MTTTTHHDGAPGSRPPMLLGRPSFGGTLGAVRCLGAKDVPVLLAGARPLDPARWSRYARAIRAPSDPEALAAWLLRDAPPGLVVYASDDDFAWVLARDRDALARRHHLYSPSLAALRALLDKRRLHELAAGAGLRTPRTWYPRDEAELLRLAPELSYPVLLKPRTMVLSRSGFKGLRVDGPAGLVAGWRVACASLRYAPSLLASLPEAAAPMVQAYHAGLADAVATVSGFIDETHQHFVARASTKLLQSPRGLGVGIAFESRPLCPRLAAGIRALCAGAGYHGVFDVELLDGPEPLLIDFNPRFYNQITFEVARGLPSPWLVYLGAIGAREELAAEVALANRAGAGQAAIFCNKFKARLELLFQTMAGTVPATEAGRWRDWYASHRARAVDPYDSSGDQGPLAFQWLSELAGAARHPRAFVRQTILLRR